MRCFFTIFSRSRQLAVGAALMALVTSVAAQGSIGGTVHATDGSPMEGVTVTANGSPSYGASRNPNRAILDMSTIEDTISIQGRGALVSTRVSVSITHGWRSDLIVTLVHPDGTAVILHNRTGGSASDLVATYPDTTPAQPLTTLLGKSPNGLWTLRVEDALWGDQGTLNGWSLALQCAYGSFQATTDSLGRYNISTLGVGSYSVTAPPTSLGTWMPPSHALVLGSSVSNANFILNTMQLSGSIRFNDRVANFPDRVNIEFRAASDLDRLESVAWVQLLPTSTAGVFQFRVDPSQMPQWPDTYVLSVDTGSYLRRNSGPLFVPTPAQYSATFDMINGDIDFSNEIDVNDFLIMAGTYEVFPPLVASADLDGDGRVDIQDFLILAANYETSGDPPSRTRP